MFRKGTRDIFLNIRQGLCITQNVEMGADHRHNDSREKHPLDQEDLHNNRSDMFVSAEKCEQEKSKFEVEMDPECLLRPNASDAHTKKVH